MAWITSKQARDDRRAARHDENADAEDESTISHHGDCVRTDSTGLDR